MMGAVATDFVSPQPLVGRVRELAQIVEALGLDASHPRSGAVLLSGDAGAGKSRLLTEVCARATDVGYQVLVGHCLDFGESALPYLPFSELFGRLATESPQLAEKIADMHPAVRRLMPSSRLANDPPSRDVAAVDRSDLFEGVHAALDELGARQPLLVIVEDVHWADQSTREMLSFLFARGFASPVSLAVSYRSDDLHRRHPLRSSTAEWMRLPLVTRLQLGRLSDRDVRALIKGLGDTPLPERDIGSIVARAEGNAFFAEELVGAARYGRMALPGDLADLLLVRVDQLDAASRQAVRASAVAGRRVSHLLLSKVVDVDSAELEQALRAAVEHNVLVLVGNDGYAFRHALLAEAVYDDLLPGERLRLHQAYIAASQSPDITMPAAEIARHARAAHDRPTAIASSIEAGDEAMSVGGPDEAAHHYEVALELVTGAEVSGDADAGIDVTGLVVKTADAITAAGHPYRAVELLRDHVAYRSAGLSDTDQARLLLALAANALITDTLHDPLESTTRALELVPSDQPTPLRAQLISMHARAHAAHGHDDEAAQWANEALGVGNALRLHTVVAEAAITLGIIDKRAGDPEASRRALIEIAAEARAKNDVVGELRALHNLGFIHLDSARLVEAQQVYEEAARRATAAGRPWAPYGLDARFLAAVTAYIRGEWAQVESIVDMSGQSPPPVAEALLSGVGLQVAAGRGDDISADVIGRSRATWERDGVIAVTAGAAAIDLLGDRGDVAAAEALHDEVVDLVNGLWQMPLFQARVRLSALLLGQLATEATRAASEDRPGLVQRSEALLAAADETYRWHLRKGRMTGPEAAAWMARAVAEHARVRWLAALDAPASEDLVTAWEQAVSGFEAMGHVFEVARSQARLGAVLSGSGRPAEAKPLLAAARDVAQRLGAQPLLREIRTLRGGVQRSTDTARHGETLTPRELQIVALVAEGRSNGEIAQQLFISIKTVSVHVSNILAKLGASGRGEAAAVARRRGLLP
jgi:DNA-binding NarL/FixJ family response regulator